VCSPQSIKSTGYCLIAAAMSATGVNSVSAAVGFSLLDSSGVGHTIALYGQYLGTSYGLRVSNPGSSGDGLIFVVGPSGSEPQIFVAGVDTNINFLLAAKGNGFIRSLSSIRPYYDNTVNLGSATFRWVGVYSMTVNASDKVIVSENLPTISSCGTSPPAAADGSSNQGGQFTLGTGSPTSCTVTFATAWPNHAYCTVTPVTGYTGTYHVGNSNVYFTVTLGTGTNSVQFNYSCNGN
jgi:hypothetical protein